MHALRFLTFPVDETLITDMRDGRPVYTPRSKNASNNEMTFVKDDA